MKLIEKALNKLEGKLLTITRNTITGKYELEIGLPKNWVCKSTDDITVEVKKETDNGKLLLISSKENEIVIDDLVDFVNFIIDKNEEIQKKEKEIDDILKKAREELENKVKVLYDEVENMKENSFNATEENNESKTKTSKIEVSDEKLENKLT